MGDVRVDPRAQQMTSRVIDLSADDRAVVARHSSKGALPSPLSVVGHRFSGALFWLGAWTALVLMQATAVSAQKQVPFRYALMSSAINYYTLAILSVAVWH